MLINYLISKFIDLDEVSLAWLISHLQSSVFSSFYLLHQVWNSLLFSFKKKCKMNSQVFIINIYSKIINLCILDAINIFSSNVFAARNVNLGNLATSPSPDSEPCYDWLGFCNGPRGDAEHNQLCKKRCTLYYHKEHDGFCAKYEGFSVCYCPTSCGSPGTMRTSHEYYQN